MSGKPQPGVSPKYQVGMVDPYINETVTHVAELDVDAFRRYNQVVLPLMLIIALVGICCPCLWFLIYAIHLHNRNQIEATIRGTQVYLTEHTLVCTVAHQPIETSRVTIPLANIASVMAESGVVRVNIKPTAPNVILNRQLDTQKNGSYTTIVATRSVPIYNIKNAEEFAKVIQVYLD